MFTGISKSGQVVLAESPWFWRVRRVYVGPLGSGGHSPALVRARAASLGAAAAVLGLVLFALCCTRVANFGAESAKRGRKLAAAGHEL